MTNGKKLSAKTSLVNTLIELLHKKPFQKISVNELCESAKVSRSAFYANFEDKYDLLSCCLDTAAKNLNTLLEAHSPEESFAVILDFFQKEDRFFYNIFGANPDEETRKILHRFLERPLAEALRRKAAQGAELPGPAEIVAAFYIGGLAATILYWVKSNYRLSKQELAACQRRLLKDIL